MMYVSFTNPDWEITSQNGRLVMKKPSIVPDEFYFDEYFLGYRWKEPMELYKQIYGLR